MTVEDKAREIQDKNKETLNSVGQFFGKLFQSRDITHLEHLKTNSFAAHKALNEFYDGVLELTDDLIESYQGIKGITEITIPASKVPTNIVDYLNGLYVSIKTDRVKFFNESQLLNITDEILSLINSTVYKLKFLK